MKAESGRSYFVRMKGAGYDLLLQQTIHSGFEEAISRVTQALKEEGFGILTKIDVKDTLKKKRDMTGRTMKMIFYAVRRETRGRTTGWTLFGRV